MRSYTVNENHIGSVVSKILRYRQTDTDPETFIKGIKNKQSFKSLENSNMCKSRKRTNRYGSADGATLIIEKLILKNG